MAGRDFHTWVGIPNNFSSCQYGMDTLDLRPPPNCTNVTQCEVEWPCEVREYWQNIHPFVDITRGFLSYGTVFFCILGILLNGLSFYVLMSSGLARNGSGFYLVALAVCDTGNLIFNYAIGVARGELTEFNNYFQNSEWLCRFHGVFVEIFQLISAWVVVGFTIERSFAIWYPILLRTSRRHRSKLVVLSCSVVFTLFSLSKLFLVGFEKDSVFGYVPCSSERYVWQGMAYIRVAFQTWIPTVLVFIFNCLMFWKLRRININRNQLTGYLGYRQQASGPNKRRTLQQSLSFSSRPSPTTPMLVAVSLAYLILVLPLGTVQTVELYWTLKRHAEVSTIEPFRTEYIEWVTTKLLLKYIRCFCFAFYQINFTINFFLYCAAGVQFRVHLIFKLNYWYNSLKNLTHVIFGCPSKLDDHGHGNTSTKTLTSQVNSLDSLSSTTRVLPKHISRSQHKKNNLSWEKALITGTKKTVSFPNGSPEPESPVILNDIVKVNGIFLGEDLQLNTLRCRERLNSDPGPCLRRNQGMSNSVSLTDINGRRFSVVI